MRFEFELHQEVGTLAEAKATILERIELIETTMGMVCINLSIAVRRGGFQRAMDEETPTGIKEALSKWDDKRIYDVEAYFLEAYFEEVGTENDDE